jgi:2-phosphosulfolactate phosphatase
MWQCLGVAQATVRAREINVKDIFSGDRSGIIYGRLIEARHAISDKSRWFGRPGRRYGRPSHGTSCTVGDPGVRARRTSAVIDVAFTPAQLRRARTTVVIDALRATSTVVSALGAGYRRVRIMPSVDAAARLRGPGRVLAGEHRYVTPAGFDHGNSPADAARRRGEELVLATTNGTPAVVAAGGVSDTVLLASMLNLTATIVALRTDTRDIQLLCSGAEGEVALEDVYVAGRIAARLPGPRSDAALVAVATCRRYHSPLRALQASAAAGRLRAVGMAPDLAYCARESVLDLVATVTAGRSRDPSTGGAVAVVATRASASPAAAVTHPAAVIAAAP